MINLKSIIFLYLRLSPFIVAAFFSLQSLFFLQLSGIVYLAGLIITSFFSIIISNSFFDKYDNSNSVSICNTLSPGQRISSLPLGLITLVFSLSYFSFFILFYQTIFRYFSTIFILSCLIYYELYFVINNKCNTFQQISFSFIFSFLLGFGWAFIINLSNNHTLFLFSNYSNRESCSIDTNYFICD